MIVARSASLPSINIGPACFNVVGTVLVGMASNSLVSIWVKYEEKRAVRLTVSADCDVDDLIRVAKDELQLSERIFELAVYKVGSGCET